MRMGMKAWNWWAFRALSLFTPRGHEKIKITICLLRGSVYFKLYNIARGKLQCDIDSESYEAQNRLTEQITALRNQNVAQRMALVKPKKPGIVEWSRQRN